MTKWSRGKAVRALSMMVPMLFGVAVLQAEALEKVNNASVTRVASERATEGLTPQEFLTQQQELHTWIATQIPDGAARATIRVPITDQDRAELAAAQADRTQSPMRVGVVKILEPKITFTNGKKELRGDTSTARDGLLRKDAKGISVWVMTVESPGSVAVRVHFENVSIPQGAELFFFNDKGEAYGPYIGTGSNGTGEFWSNSVLGSKGTVMLRGANLNHASLSITEVGHVATDFPRVTQEEGLSGSVASFCSFNASCIENNSCINESAVNDAEGAVAKMRWISGLYIYICSGGLLADTDPGTQTPYFLTANHCMSNNNDAGNLEAYFQYSISCGSTACAGSFNPAPSPSTLGATVTATGAAGDFTLLTLNQTPPAGSTFLGWNNAPVANTSGVQLHRVSHPSGAPQAYSHHQVDASTPTCQGWPRGQRIYSVDIQGATEGGSSGSPVVNSAGEVVGQLSGCCGYNCGNECDSANNWTVDGAFAYYWNSVAEFLDPPSSGCTTNGDCNDGNSCTTDVCSGGTCSNTPINCDDGNACTADSCSGGVCSNVAITCDDANACTIDSCDVVTGCVFAPVSCPGGQVCDAGVCVTPPSCGAKGVVCTANSDCCSNNCKGRSGRKTCK